jgi:hypothetical protein
MIGLPERRLGQPQPQAMSGEPCKLPSHSVLNRKRLPHGHAARPDDADCRRRRRHLGALAKRTGLEQSTPSRNLRTLEGQGLIEITIVENDLRPRTVWLTESGAPRLETAVRCGARRRQNWRDGFRLIRPGAGRKQPRPCSWTERDLRRSESTRPLPRLELAIPTVCSAAIFIGVALVSISFGRRCLTADRDHPSSAPIRFGRTQTRRCRESGSRAQSKRSKEQAPMGRVRPGAPRSDFQRCDPVAWLPWRDLVSRVL